MIKEKTNHSAEKGFSLIEMLVLIFVFSVITIAFYNAYTLGISHIIESKNRIAATALASERIEIIRNMSYENIGTVDGVPVGPIAQYETISKDIRTFYVYTFVRYVDDPFDRLEGDDPADTTPNDYKQVRVRVAWENDIASQRAVEASAMIIPRSRESEVGGGTLSINVVDDSAVPISGAMVHIYNVDGGTNLIAFTGSSGNILLPGTPEAIQKYAIEISKSGYYETRTYSPPPGSSFNPLSIHASVIKGAMNRYTFTTNKVAEVTIHTRDVFGNYVPNVGFNLKGGKQIGSTIITPPDEPEAVYDFDEDSDTGPSGQETFGDRSSGNYFFTLKNNPSYEFIRVSPGEEINNKFFLPAASPTDVEVVLAEKTLNSVLVTASSSTGGKIEGALVRLSNTALGFDEELATNRYGQAFFPETNPPLTEGDYEITVTAEGYQTATDNVLVSGFNNKEIILLPN